MFLVFYSVSFYICVLMTCSSSYCLGDTMRMHGICAYIYTCMYVCMYILMYVCMHGLL